MVHIIIKESGRRSESAESALYRRITGGTISNEDIEMAVTSGDRTLKKAIQDRMNRGWKEKKELDDEFGKDSFQYRDRDGHPVKETELLTPEDMANMGGEDTPEVRERQKHYATQRRAGVAPENIKPQTQREMFPWAFPRQSNA